MKVKVWEEKINIPTYEVGEENENPDLTVEGNYRVYPYTRNLHLKGIRKNYKYKAVFLENKYLKIIVLPELGGRIYSALDKISGKDMFYKNTVIKPGLVQLYGAWIACGVEFNFPMGHSITSFKTIDYDYYSENDKSGIIVVGNIDLSTRMRWSTFIKLYPDVAYIEITIKLHNRTNLPERYYFWSNAAVEATDGLRIIFPANKVINEGRGIRNFPIDNVSNYYKGVDLSYYKNFHHGGEIFAYKCKENFFGYYNEDYDFGVAHYSNRFEESGKKFFTWGTSDAGLMWRNFLTDEMPPYTEFQCGPFMTQGEFEIMNPYTSNIWKGYWIPVRGMKSFMYVNTDIILNLKYDNSMIKIYINSTRSFPQSNIILIINDKVIYKKEAFLKPEELFFDSIALSHPNPDDKLTLKIINNNATLVEYNQILSKIGYYESEEESKSKNINNIVERLYLEGLDLEKRRLYEKARKKYLLALEKSPKYLPAMLRLGIIALIRGLFSKAEEEFSKILKYDNYNPDVYYFLGLSYKLQNKLLKAKECFWKLSLDKSYLTVASFVELGKIALIEKDFKTAVDLFEKAYSKNLNNPKIVGLYTAALRRFGKIKEARKIINDFIVREPIDGLILSEYCLINNNSKYKRLLNRILYRVPENSIELAMDYIQSGLYDEAIGILNKGKIKFFNYPLIYYYLGFVFQKLGKEKEAKKNYLLGAKARCKRVFPWQIESIEILNSAIKYFPNLPNTYEYLGNFMFYKYRYKEGLKNFYKAKKLGSTSSVVYRNIALGHLRVKLDYCKMARWYEKAVVCNPNDWEIYYEADRFLAGYGYLDIRKRIVSKITSKVLQHPKAMERRAKLYVDLRKYDEAIEFIKDKQFYPWEGENLSRQIYEDAYNGKAELLIKAEKYNEALKYIRLAMEYPKNIGVLKVKNRVHCRSLYLQGIIGKKLNDLSAKRYWDQILNKELTDKFVSETHIYFYFSVEEIFFNALVLIEYGKIKDANRILQKVLKFCRKNYWYLLHILSYLEGWGFVTNFRRVLANDRMLCGYRISGVCKKFLKEVAKICNEKRKIRR
jgi:tetratricopeptide (TPR) repeat protein